MTANPIPEAVVEAVARAICMACEENPDRQGDARGNEFRWQDYLGPAHAAIQALTSAQQPAERRELVVAGWQYRRAGSDDAWTNGTEYGNHRQNTEADPEWETRLVYAFPHAHPAPQQPAAKPCTCHPDDNPPNPCPRKYALDECRKAAPKPDAVAGLVEKVKVVKILGEDDSEQHRVELAVGVQKFRIGPDYWDTKEEADWYADQFRAAIAAAQAQPKRRPYNASASLSEYGVFPECDAQQPADDEVVFIDGVGAGRSSVKSCRDGVQWIRVGDRVYWPLSDSDAKRLQSACCGNGSFDGPATPASAAGVEGRYHPCTHILIEGLKRLEGGAAVLAEWDRARAQADAALAQGANDGR